jgi:hypothetical protein
VGCFISGFKFKLHFHIILLIELSFFDNRFWHFGEWVDVVIGFYYEFINFTLKEDVDLRPR